MPKLNALFPFPELFPARLAEGYQSFLSGPFAHASTRYQRLAEKGQKPEIMLIGCVDSRVSPEVIFDAAPGEILVARNVANLAPPYEADRSTQHGTSAAVEFGVQALGVRHLVVMGHASCGGVRAFADDQEPLSPSDFIGRWVSQIAPAAASLPPIPDEPRDAFIRRLEMASIVQSLKNLMTFPWLREKVEAGTLHLHGAYFGIATGKLLVLNQETGVFEPVGTGPETPPSLLHCS